MLKNENPGRIMYASEFMPPRSFENWQTVEDLPYVIGNFSWTAIFNPDSWPVFNNFQGDLDLIGNAKTPYYYQHVVWRESKVEMFVHRPVPPGKMEIVSPWGFPE
jgi:beta-galactosidase